jgi:hypothetical protein
MFSTKLWIPNPKNFIRIRISGFVILVFGYGSYLHIYMGIRKKLIFFIQYYKILDICYIFNKW